MTKQILLTLACLASATTAGAEGSSFSRPDCSAYKGQTRGEARCFRDFKKSVRQTNFAALQKTGLMFNYLARPDIAASPAAQQLFKDKVEGTFALKFSVKADGTVYDVKVADISSEAMRPMAKVMTDTLSQWTFFPVTKPVVDVPYRYVALYPKDDKPKKAWEREDQ